MYKVGIDTTSLRTGHASRGIGKYTKELIKALIVLKFDDIEIVPCENGFTSFSGDLDLHHYPYFDLFFPTLPLVKTKPTIVTVHDIIPLIFPDAYPCGIKGKLSYLFQEFSLKTVKSIITDSYCSKEDIVKYLKYPENKITTVYLAPSEIFQKLDGQEWKKDIVKKYNLPEKFVLYVGDVNWNKNLLTLARACKSIKTVLVIVGKQAVNEAFDKVHPENKPFVNFLNEFGKDTQVLRLGYVPDEDLVKIYNLATVYCLPSFYEGFGLSVLEAMACGTPVACSKIASLPEISGEAAIFFDPYNQEDLAISLNRLMRETSLRTTMINKGFLQAGKFSWKNTALETVKAYRQVLTRKGNDK
jgi:glycosyltransferase involved in cell wall biosynthesis